MIYCFDLDGTLCSITKNQEYIKAKPYINRIKVVNKLYDQGHEIKIHTARGMSSKLDFELLTRMQLYEWEVKFHELIMGKPSADFYIDDKSVTPEMFFE